MSDNEQVLYRRFEPSLIGLERVVFLHIGWCTINIARCAKDDDPSVICQTGFGSSHETFQSRVIFLGSRRVGSCAVREHLSGQRSTSRGTSKGKKENGQTSRQERTYGRKVAKCPAHPFTREIDIAGHHVSQKDFGRLVCRCVIELGAPFLGCGGIVQLDVLGDLVGLLCDT